MSTESTAAVFAEIVQRDAPAAADLQAVAPDPSVRLDAGLEALSLNTRRVYGAALRTWGLWCAVHGVDALAAPPASFRARTCSNGLRTAPVSRRCGLSMDAREAAAARSVLESCSSFSMVIVDREATVTPTPEASPEADPLSLYDTNGNGRITCVEAREHGIAPVRSDHPAYPYMRDSDGDGVVCEES